MKMQKHHITATACLIVSIIIMVVSGMNFLAVRELPMPISGAGVTEVKMLSDWFGGLKGTANDTPVYVLRGARPGGSALVLGSVHANEVSSNMSAFVFIENAVVDQGTVYVIPYTNRSAMTHNDPGEGTIQHFTINTRSGERTFRYGSRATNPIHQWPDPNVYTHFPSGQRLSGSDTRNINRAFPGRPDGNLTEKTAFAISEMIRAENINMTFDLHEASPEYPVINATVAHQNAMEMASIGTLNMLMSGINIGLESSPVNLHGLTHRGLGDYTDTLVVLMETANASQGRLRGATTLEQVLGGKDRFYVINAGLGMLYVPYDESGHSIEERVGRHLQSVYEYIGAYNELYPDNQVVYSGVPGYSELYLNANPADLGGAQLGRFLN